MHAEPLGLRGAQAGNLRGAQAGNLCIRQNPRKYKTDVTLRSMKHSLCNGLSRQKKGLLKKKVNDVPSSDVCSKLDVDDYEQVSAINYDAVCFCLGGR